MRRRHAEAMALIGFAVEIYWLQLEAGRHFLHEHPATATSWREKIVLELRCDTVSYTHLTLPTICSV